MRQICKCSSKVKIYAAILSLLCIAAVFANYNYYQNTHKAGEPKFRPGAKEKNYVQVFTEIYATNEWTQGSGVGSDPEAAKPYMLILQDVIADPRFTTIVDIGCGDWQFMRHIQIPEGKTYMGYDVVQSLINDNTQAFARDNVQFAQTTSLKDLEAMDVTGDLLIIKDVMQHWPLEEIKYFIKNILPRFKYALITNQYVPNDQGHNRDMQMGPVHSIGLLEAPFKLKHATPVLEYDGPDHKQVLFYENPNLS